MGHRAVHQGQSRTAPASQEKGEMPKLSASPYAVYNQFMGDQILNTSDAPE